jgi:aminoglycoside phosphotransferase (APT) family kinase protein
VARYHAAISRGEVPAVVKEHWERSHPLVEIDAVTLGRMLAPVSRGRRIEAASLLGGGLANASYRVDLAGMDAPVVVRAYLRDASAAEREAAVLRLVRDRVPVPRVLHVGRDEQAGLTYAVLTWMEGVTVNALISAGEPAPVLAAARSAGRALAQLRGFSFPRAGLLGPDLQVQIPFDAGPAGLVEFVRRCLFDDGAADGLTPTMTDRLWRFVQDNAHELSAIEGDATLVHSDFNPPNLLVRTGGARPEISAILDWEFAHSGTPLADIGNMLRDQRSLPAAFRSEFIDGYVEGGGSLPDGWERLAALVDLTALLDFLRRDRPGETMLRDVRDLVEATVTTWGAP